MDKQAAQARKGEINIGIDPVEAGRYLVKRGKRSTKVGGTRE